MKITVLAIILVLALAVSASAQVEQVLAGIRTDKERYALGERVRITYAVENRSDRPITFNFRSGQQFDIIATQNAREIWRWSAGRVFIQALTSFTLEPGERRTFEADWNQRDAQDRQAAPGVYELRGELTATDIRPDPVARRTTIGGGPAIVTATVDGIVTRVDALLGRTVSVEATYRGLRPDPDAPACRPGPPVTRGDWAIQDRTGCIFVTGATSLDPVDDLNKQVRVLGVVRKTDAGQPYIELRSVTELAR